MKEKVLVILLLVWFVIGTIVALKIKIKTEYLLLNRKQRIIRNIAIAVLWINGFLLFPLTAVFAILFYVFEIPIGDGESHRVNCSSYDSNASSSSSARDSNRNYEQKCYHYNENKISTIYNDGTVVRSDGVCGYRYGDFIQYDNGTTGHIIDLDDGRKIIEKWQ